MSIWVVQATSPTLLCHLSIAIHMTTNINTNYTILNNHTMETMTGIG